MESPCKPVLQDRVNIMPTKNVRRSLFEPVNHDELEASLKEKMDTIRNESSLRWNFNFAEETPLAGDYEWEKVTEDEYIPSCYTKSYSSHGQCSEAVDYSAQLPYLTNVPTTPKKQRRFRKSRASSVTPDCIPALDDDIVRVQVSPVVTSDTEEDTDAEVKQILTPVASSCSRKSDSAFVKRKRALLTDYFQCKKKRTLQSPKL